MAKAFFRWLRGELNGYYITSINNSLNKSTEELTKFLVNFSKQQFNYDEIDKDYLEGLCKFAGVYLVRTSLAESLSSVYMTDSKIVDNTEYSERGLYLPSIEDFNFFHLNTNTESGMVFKHTTQDEDLTDINTLANESLKSSLVGDEEIIGYLSSNAFDIFTDEGIIKTDKITAEPPATGAYVEVYGNQFSFLAEDMELSTEVEQCVSLRLTESYEEDGIEYSERGLYKPIAPNYPDINTLATTEARSSLVGNEEIIGYISENAKDVLDDKGFVRETKVLSTPPYNEAYSEYYGNQFLFLSEGETTYEEVNKQLIIDLFEALQLVRYNGASLDALVKIIGNICPDGLVRVTSIESSVDGNSVSVYYSYDSSVEIEHKQQRLSLLEYLIEEKFKQIRFISN